MDFSLTENQSALRDQVLAFAGSTLSQVDAEARDRDQEFPRADWQQCAEFGILGLHVPEVYGGRGLPALDAVIALDALGYACPDTGLTFGINAQMWTIQPALQLFGSEEQKQTVLRDLATGKRIGAFANTEPDTGSDSAALKTTARKVDGGYVLNGHKMYITLGPVSDVVLVFATVNPDRGKWGVTAFLVERGAPGLTLTEARSKMGLRSIPMGDVLLEDCFVPENGLVGREGSGVSLFSKVMEYERGFMLASQVGAMARQLDETVAYAKGRTAFGESIGKFQSVSNRIADMKLRLETARLLLYRSAWKHDQGESLHLDGALTKLHLSESFVESSLDALRTHGGWGYLAESGIERYLRDGAGSLIYSGTNDIQRKIIARLLGL